jgi:YVTN family beta-propeller protein
LQLVAASIVLALAVTCSGGDGVPTPGIEAASPSSTAPGKSEPVPTAAPVETSTATPASTAAPESGPATVKSPTVPATGIPVGPAPLSGPQSSSAVALTPDGRLVMAVNPDSDSVSIVDTGSLQLLAEVAVGDDPRTLAVTPSGTHAVVANHAGASVSAIDLSSFEEVARWPVGPMPYGVVTDGTSAYLTEFGAGTVSAIDLASGDISGSIEVGPFPAGLALIPGVGSGDQLLVTHLFDGDLTSIEIPALRVSWTVSTGADSNVSQFVTVSPDGASAFVPHTRSNVSNTTLVFDSTVFPVVNVVDLETRLLINRERITLDTADRPVSLPFAMALTPDATRAFIVNAGSDQVSVIDMDTNRAVANLSVGANPRGIALSPDGERAYVDNVLDGTLSVIDAETPAVTNTLKLTEIPLDPEILLGKQIFNSAAEPVLSTDGWIACAACHFDGGGDQRTWLGFPDGPRNTPSLLGVGETLPVHWSGDLDELADVELTIRNIQAGSGLVEGDELDSLGPSLTGVSVDLDALAAYMDSLKVPPPPHETDPDMFNAGAQVFQALGCSECHIPGTFVDGMIHDVGTGDPELEKNSHGRGTAFDTPSLRGLWSTAPYLHDGAAPTLADVLRSGETHAVAGDLSDAEIDDLVAYLLALPVPG